MDKLIFCKQAQPRIGAGGEPVTRGYDVRVNGTYVGVVYRNKGHGWTAVALNGRYASDATRNDAALTMSHLV